MCGVLPCFLSMTGAMNIHEYANSKAPKRGEYKFAIRINLELPRHFLTDLSNSGSTRPNIT